MWGFKKQDNSPHKSTSSSPRRPTTLQEELSLTWRMERKYTKKKKNVILTNASKTSEKEIGGSSVFAVDHKKNKIQHPWTVSHARIGLKLHESDHWKQNFKKQNWRELRLSCRPRKKHNNHVLQQICDGNFTNYGAWGRLARSALGYVYIYIYIYIQRDIYIEIYIYIYILFFLLLIHLCL